MGHVQSKRKKEKQIKRDISDYIVNSITNGDPENYKLNAQMKINRLSADLERLSVGSGGYYSRDSLVIPTDSWRQSRISDLSDESDISECKVKTSFSFQELNVDNHPVLTKLQNEQNVRLEKMEERMSQIRLHAMQEADRRKFAHLFKAKNHEGPTTELLNKVKDKLPKIDCDNNGHLRKATIRDVDNDDRGEIIPVTVVTQSKEEKTENNNTTKMEPIVNKSESYLQSLPALRAVNMSKLYFIPDLFMLITFFIYI